jgi:hypothetical protein
LRTALCYLGVPNCDKSYMFGDNKSVVDSSMQVNAKLHKCRTILSFHCVRECIASKMVGFYFIHGESNPANILSTHWGYSQIWTRLKALLFWTDIQMILRNRKYCYIILNEWGVTRFALVFRIYICLGLSLHVLG